VRWRLPTALGLVLVLFAIALAVISLGAPKGAAWCATPAAAAAVPDWRVAKKGVGTWPYDGADSALASAGLSWFYTWRIGPDGVAQPPGTRFVPMIWGADTVDEASLAQARTHGDTLLGFNEPDVAAQANMTVEQALDLWPQLQTTGQRLGSPAVSANGATAGGWLDRFMTGASQRGYRVDFVAVHWYGANFTDPIGEARELCRYVTAVYERYGKPVWLTEFALADFSDGVEQARYPSDAEQAAFVRAALPLLQRLPHLERYAWFALANTASSYRTGLYSDASTLTRAGEAYFSAGKEPPYGDINP
jgi:hypothetical protein